MTKAERLLAAGLEEARSDLEFIRTHTKDVAMQQVIDAAIGVAGRYLVDALEEEWTIGR